VEKKITVQIDYPEDLVPDNVQVLVDRLESADNREVARKAKQEEENGEFSDGLIDAVKKSIQLRNRSNVSSVGASRIDRIDRILNIRNTDGKATSRKF